MVPSNKNAYKLMHQGVAAFAEMESVGMPLSMERLESESRSVKQLIREKEDKLRASEVYVVQRNRFHKESNLNSRDQLAKVLFDDFKITGGRRSEKTKKYVLDDEDLEDMLDADLSDSVYEYIREYRKLSNLLKLYGTYLKAFRTEAVDGRLHGFFHLHSTTTYRTSSSNPNLQNIPIRNPVIGKIIRSIVVPHDPDYRIMEVDFSQLEIVIGACLHQDPNLMDHLISGFDFHKVTASELFLLDSPEKHIRGLGKTANFACNYGDHPIAIAGKMWKQSRRLKQDGVPIHEHLSKHGIKRLGHKTDNGKDTFVGHTQKVLDRYWNERYPGYHAWRNATWDKYCRTGYLYTATGFRIHGVMKRTEIYNVDTQGSASHVLLYSLIVAQKRLKQEGLRARIFCPIHDSLLLEVHQDDVHAVSALLEKIMTIETRKHYPWIIMPLKTETEVGNPCWATKEKLT